MAIKSSNVTARVEPEIKEKAEAILAKLGISASSGINMFYRQIILQNGLPFRPSIPASPRSLDEMTKEEPDAEIEKGYQDMPDGLVVDSKTAFSVLRNKHGS